MPTGSVKNDANSQPQDKARNNHIHNKIQANGSTANQFMQALSTNCSATDQTFELIHLYGTYLL